MELRADVLARMLVLQSVIGQLPDEDGVFAFLGRGLEDVPGVARVAHRPPGAAPAPAAAPPLRFPVQVNGTSFGELEVALADAEAFAPYRQYVHNLAFMVAVILDGRRLEALQQRHAHELEEQVEQRTRSLRHEVEERQLAERRAREAQQRAERYLEIAEALILELDPEGRIQLINERGGILLDRPPAELLGRDWFEAAIPAPERAGRREAFLRALAGPAQPRHHEHDIVDRHGRILHISWHDIPLRGEDGGSRGMVSSGIDITAHKQAEEERDRLNALLHQREKMDAIGQLAGGIAHDFNNQLSVITGYAELLLAQSAQSAQRRKLELVLAAAHRSADLTRQLLSFARRAPMRQERIDLAVLLAEVAEMLRRSIDRRITVVLALDARRQLDGDPSRLQNAVLNLCLNARDAMPQGGTLRLATADLDLDPGERRRRGLGADTGAWIAIEVADTGTGMPPEVQARIFEPFFTTKGPGKGTGLGLATVHGTVHQMGGGITVESRTGAGTTFRVLLPAGHATAAEAPAAIPAGGGRRLRLLVVDDEPDVLSALCEQLAARGHRAEGVAGGSAALAWYREHGPEVDLVLLDLNMPGMGGAEVLRALLRQDPLARVAIVTGNADAASSAGVLALGAAAVIEKPPSPAALDGLERHARPTPPPPA